MIFVRSGYVTVGDGELKVIGQNGIFWSSKGLSVTNVSYNLSFGGGAVNPANNNHNRYIGNPLRCLAS